MYTLKNQDLTVTIASKGAELSSILDKNGREWLWQRDPEIWAGQAPLLFPFVGRLIDGKYTYKGETYDMTLHGFARDYEFKIAQEGENFVTFYFEDQDATQKIYPFSFGLSITYTLEGTKLTKTHKVENKSGEDMYYEVGGHDGYRLCFSPEEKMDDCRVRVPGATSIFPYTMDEKVILQEEKKEIKLDQEKVTLKPAAFGLDCLVLEELPQRKLEILDGTGKARVKMSFEDFPVVTLWTAPKAVDTNYVCLEPWTTLPDGYFMGRDITDKKGIRKLSGNQTESLSFSTEFILE